MPSTAGSTERARPVPAAERERFDRDGYLIIRGALTPDEVSRYAAARDRTYAAATSGGRVRPGAFSTRPIRRSGRSALTVIRGRRFPRPGR
jgi:hypothetical protein